MINKNEMERVPTPAPGRCSNFSGLNATRTGGNSVKVEFLAASLCFKARRSACVCVRERFSYQLVEERGLRMSSLAASSDRL